MKMAKKSFKKKANVFKGESNPFNIKVNREKHQILGQKVKGTKGLPGVSHAASQAKRRELWQKTKVKVQKANSYVDKRLMDGSLPLEERKTNRLIREQKRKLKKNIFNLNDDEELTHLGLSLQDVKSFKDNDSASEDEDQLGPAFVKQAHFGGFNIEHKEQPKSHKEVIDELIVESKQKKHDKKIEKELTVGLTEKLDQEWKDMLSIMSGIKATKPVETTEKNDPYDVIAKELKYEMKAAPATRIKTAEELEKEEQERIRELEQEKRLRMIDDAEITTQKANDHLSADSIYDDFDLQPIPVEYDVPAVNTSHQNELEYSDSEESVDSLESAQLHKKIADDADMNVPQNDNLIICDKNDSGIPKSLEEFEELLSSLKLDVNDPEEISKVIENILKNKLKYKSAKMLSRVDAFFCVLIEYSLKCLDTNMAITGILPPYLYVLASASPLNTSSKLLYFLDKEQSEFKEQRKNFPPLRTLLILKYCSILYSVSDFRHPVITPAMLFMCDILSSACILSFPNITSRLFVCSIILDCISESKRLVPEALCFLKKALNLAVPKAKHTTHKMRKKEFSLELNEISTLAEIPELNLLNTRNSLCDDDKKLSIISLTVNQLQQFANLYLGLPSYLEMFSPIRLICSQLPTDEYPTCLQVAIHKFSETISKKPTPLCYLVFQKSKPKLLRMFEPSFDSKYNSRKDDINKKFKLVKRVSQKIKKEERGLLREMRRDTQMIGAEKLKERLESDAERKRKVKELYHELSVQEGEYKKFMKKK